MGESALEILAQESPLISLPHPSLHKYAPERAGNTPLTSASHPVGPSDGRKEGKPIQLEGPASSFRSVRKEHRALFLVTGLPLLFAESLSEPTVGSASLINMH